MARIKLIPAEGYGAHIRSIQEIADRVENNELEIIALNESIEILIEGLIAQGTESNVLLEDVKQVIEEQLKLLNARTEEAFDTKLNEEDIT